jgi:type IV secretory pathway VirB2 component (pilin)
MQIEKMTEEGKDHWMLIFGGLIFIIIVIVGGIMVIIGKYDSPSYNQWVDDLTKIALALGIYGAGRAVAGGLNGRKNDP